MRVRSSPRPRGQVNELAWNGGKRARNEALERRASDAVADALAKGTWDVFVERDTEIAVGGAGRLERSRRVGWWALDQSRPLTRTRARNRRRQCRRAVLPATAFGLPSPRSSKFKLQKSARSKPVSKLELQRSAPDRPIPKLKLQKSARCRSVSKFELQKLPPDGPRVELKLSQAASDSPRGSWYSGRQLQLLATRAR